MGAPQAGRRAHVKSARLMKARMSRRLRAVRPLPMSALMGSEVGSVSCKQGQGRSGEGARRGASCAVSLDLIIMVLHEGNKDGSLKDADEWDFEELGGCVAVGKRAWQTLADELHSFP